MFRWLFFRRSRHAPKPDELQQAIEPSPGPAPELLPESARASSDMPLEMHNQPNPQLNHGRTLMVVRSSTARAMATDFDEIEISSKPALVPSIPTQICPDLDSVEENPSHQNVSDDEDVFPDLSAGQRTIYFAHGRYAPREPDGPRLTAPDRLAHPRNARRPSASPRKPVSVNPVTANPLTEVSVTEDSLNEDSLNEDSQPRRSSARE